MKLITRTLLAVASMALFAGNAFAADANEIWAANCVSCHGKDGSGSTIMGKKYSIKDYRDPQVQAAMTDQKISATIKDGVVVGGQTRMKAFKDKLTPQEIDALVAHIRAFKK